MDGILCWPREFSLLKYVTDINHARALIVSYLKMTEVFMEASLRRNEYYLNKENFEKSILEENFEKSILEGFDMECKRQNIKNEFIHDTLQSLSSITMSMCK